MFRTNTSRFTGGLGQPAALVAQTDTPFAIKPGEALFQLTVIEFVPCPDTITPGAATVQVYVSPVLLATW